VDSAVVVLEPCPTLSALAISKPFAS